MGIIMGPIPLCPRGLASPTARLAGAVVTVVLAVGLVACNSTPAPAESGGMHISSNRPDGEAYAGKGELVLRIIVAGPDANVLDAIKATEGKARAEMAHVDLRYGGLDSLGRAVFQRHDVDQLASGRPASDGAGGHVQTLTLDLRHVRQLHVQGKTIEILDASDSGVVFRLYTEH
jgi:hypothetical protein